MRILQSLVAFGLVALVAGCGGGSQGVAPPLGSSPDAAGPAGTLKFTITVPKKVNPKTKSYVSPGSKGLVINFVLGSKKSTQTFTLEKGAKGCSSQAGGLVCTISISLAPGHYASTMMVYDQPTSSGFLLSAQLSGLTYIINAGKTTTIRPTLEGNIASLKFAKFPHGCIGSSGNTAFEVQASDFDGYKIAGTYLQQIALSDSDTSGNTTLAVSGPDNPPPNELLSSFDTPSVAWNGQPLTGGSATITATAGTSMYQTASATLWAGPGDVIFNYNGGRSNHGRPQYQTVSPCANSSVTAWLWGAAGGHALGSGASYGGLVVATIPVTTGQRLEIVVGGVGGSTGNYSQQTGGVGGYNGGGIGSGCLPNSSCSGVGGGGGGGTDVRQGGSGLQSRVIVAGGGGGGAYYGGGGGGGGLSGAAGNTQGNYCVLSQPLTAGGGGTQSSGGAGPGSSSGSFGVGALAGPYCWITTSGDHTFSWGSGGGGGGWYGGGGGNYGGPGGGGSGYAEPSATNVFMQTSFNSGQGIAEICWPLSSDCKVTLHKLHGMIRKPRRH